MGHYICEWCGSDEKDAAYRIVHKGHCCLAPLKDPIEPIAPRQNYCSGCMDRFTGSQYQHDGECVYRRGCPHCNAKFTSVHHVKQCAKRQQWMATEKTEERNVLLSYRRPVRVSGVELPGLEGFRAVDGQNDTRWSSPFTDDQWLIVDLEEPCIISSVLITWEHAYGVDYEILVSMDDQNWDVTARQKHGKGGLEAIPTRSFFGPTVRARYVKFKGIRRGTQWGYSIVAFEVMGRTERIFKVDTTPKIDWSTKTPKEQVLGSDWWGKEVPKSIIKVIDTRKAVV